MKKTISYIAGVLILLFPAVAGAQALPFTAVDTNPATLAMGTADLTETCSISHSAFRNVTAVPFSESSLDVSAGYSMWLPTSINSSIINIAGAYNMNGKFGIAAGLCYGMNPSYEMTDAIGASKGTFSPTDIHAAVGVSYRFIPILSLGANIGYATETLAPEASYGALNADVYAMFKFGSLKAALGISELGGTVKSQSGASFRLPAAANAGIGYDLELSNTHAVNINADVSYYFAGEIAAAAGVSYTCSKMVTARAGYHYGGNSVLPSFASAGIGLRLFGAKLDFAYLFASDVMKNTMSISIGYGF